MSNKNMPKDSNSKASEFPEVNCPHMQMMLECMSTCMACSKKCLEEGNKTTAAMCAECADICSLAIKAGCGHAHFEEEIMDLCSNACRSCAAECNKMQSAHCKKCADICTRCADACSLAFSR